MFVLRPSAVLARPLLRLRAFAAAVRYAADLLWRYAPGSSALLLACGIAAGVATPLAVWAMQGLVNTLSQPGEAPAGSWSAILPWLLLVLVASLLSNVVGSAVIAVASVVRERLDAGLRARVYAQSLALPLATFEQPEYYTKLETGRAALDGSFVYVLQYLAQLASSLIGLAGLLFLYAQVHWLLAAILLATAIVQAQLGVRQSRAFARMHYGSSPLRREQGYWAGLLSSREAAPELRLFGLADHFLERWQAVFWRYLAEAMAARRQMAVRGVAIVVLREGVGLVTVIALLVLGLRRDVGIGTVVALLYGISRFQGLTGGLANQARILSDRWTTIAHLRDFLALPIERPAPARPTVPRPLHEGVRFHDVSFTYAGAARQALSNVNLLLRPGERVALVGENGAGKTTLVRLLLGLYRPTSGRITVDGIDLADLDPAAWRQEATAVFQDFVRYPTSVVENVAYADVRLLTDGTTAVDPRIVRAATSSGAADFVDALPHGYATLLGSVFEGAVDLSAGQWQRLAVARAYLREAQIVVLDEPTAALDPRGEVAAYQQFGQAAEGRCAVFISHRLGSARLAERIVVLRDGCIVEEGTHAALLAAAGEYARLYRLQAAWYQDGAEDAGS